MSIYFGEIRQMGYVVPNIEEAMEQWHRKLGVGPWFYNPKVIVKNYEYRGQFYEQTMAIALANSGAMQVELIQPREDVPSMHLDFLRAGRSGLQHMAFWTRTFAQDLKRLQDLGYKVAMSGEVGGKQGPFAYFDTEFHPGTVTELSDISGPKGKMFEIIRAAAAGWDGRDPVRDFPDMTKL
jgi:Glyoxalase/Bleomycin resistance protein/Dioxygenase superfamily